MLALVASLVCLATTETGIRPVSVWIQELSGQIGVPVRVEKSLRDALLFVERRSESPKVILREIASSLHGSVVSEKDGFAIIRTRADIARDKEALCAERSRWIKHRLKINGDHRLAMMGQGSTSEMIVSDLSGFLRKRDDLVSGRSRDVGTFNGAELLPETVLLESLLSRIGVSELANSQRGDVKVYEDNPPDGEKALPEYSDLLARYRESVEQLDRSKVPSKLVNDLQTVGRADMLKSWGLPSQASRVRITEVPSWVGLQFLIEIFDASGHRLGGSGLFAGKINAPLSTSFMMRDTEGKEDAQWVQLSAANMQAIVPVLEAKTRRLPQWYYSPTKVEPLNLFVSDVLRGMAGEQADQPTVIVANDAMWNLAKQCQSGSRLSVDTFERALKEEFGYEKCVEEGSVIWRPEDPLFAVSCHADRNALERFARALSREGQVSLRSLCELFSDSKADALSLANVWSSMAKVGRGASALSCDRSAMFLKMLGKVPDDGWDALMASKPETLAELGVTAEFSEYLVNDFTVRTEGGDLPDLYMHPVELLPSGPMPGAMVKFTVRTEAVIKQDEMGGWIPQSAFETTRPSGVRLSSSFKDGQFTVLTPRADFESGVTQTYQMGNRDELTIQFQLTGNLYISAHVHGNAEPTSGDIAYRDLPVEIRDKIWANTCRGAIDRMRRNMQGSSLLPGSGTTLTGG